MILIVLYGGSFQASSGRPPQDWISSSSDLGELCICIIHIYTYIYICQL